MQVDRAPALGRRAWLAGVAALGVAGCGRADLVEVRGAGATFPAPLYQDWIVRYEAMRPAVRLAFSPIGSGGGLRQLALGAVDFGASDVEPDDVERRLVGGPIVTVPVAKGALAIAVNAPMRRDGAPLALDLEVIARMYTGEISRWDDPAILRANPSLAAADTPVVPIARADGGGSTAIFTSRVGSWVPAFRAAVGAGRAVTFPAAIGARGSDGVARAVATIPGAIGYVESSHAVRERLSVAALAAGGGAATLPTVAAVRDAPVGATGRGYPLAAYTYLVVPQRARDARRGAAAAHFVRWVLGPGQDALRTTDDGLASGFQPIPDALAGRGRAQLADLTFDGRPLLVID